MQETKNDDSSVDESKKELDLENETTGGRRYTQTRWTIGNSAELIEGEPKEPLLVTLAWVLGPLALGLLFISVLLLR